VYSAWAPFGFLAGLYLGVLCLIVRHHAYGRCQVCDTHREPVCGCPRRPRFKTRRDMEDEL
jgi:hypothetical protein